MTSASGANELWRRVALVLGILVGLALFCYVAPAMVSLTALDWEEEQAGELKSYSGYVTEEEKRLNSLPLDEYIAEKTGGQVTDVDGAQWGTFFQQVQLASNAEYKSSQYGSRVSEEDKDDFWKPTRPVEVFFKPDEIPYSQWGLRQSDSQTAYISTDSGSETIYLRLKYHDYKTSVGAMSSPYRTAPGWLYHPYRTIGIIIMILGLLLYIFLPRRKKQPDDISYSTGSMLAGDLVGVILLLPFYGLPFLINGGTVQAITGLWPVTLVMWLIACISIYLFYSNAWNASYLIELTKDALSLVTFKGVREMRFEDMAAVDLVALSNPGWFRKLFLAVAFLSVISGRASSTQPLGTALLAEGAVYGGLEIKGRSGGKPIYIWFSDQMGGVIINHFDRVPEAIEAAGVPFNKEPRAIEGFTMFM
ncbi:MAG: hypothetical protein GX808_06325 [Syntrophomonadaceae bacterium]|jgi:hypothetical protein|nr:hypothetical protein [Syntrophomonadaceae bacterium]